MITINEVSLTNSVDVDELHETIMYVEHVYDTDKHVVFTECEPVIIKISKISVNEPGVIAVEQNNPEYKTNTENKTGLVQSITY